MKVLFNYLKLFAIIFINYNLFSQNLTYEIKDYGILSSSSVRVGNYLFYENEGSVYRIDVSDPKSPKSPVKLSSIEGMDLDYFGNYLYTFSYGQTITLNLYNVSNPLNPSKAGSITLSTGGIFKLQEKNNKLFMITDEGDNAGSQFIIYDISNPSNINSLTNYSLKNNRTDNPNDFQLSSDGKTAYLLTTLYVRVFDVSDPTNINLINEYRPFYPSITRAMEVVGNDMFISSAADKTIQRYDITDPTKFKGLETIKLSNQSYELYYDGSHLIAFDANNLVYYSIPEPSIKDKKDKNSENQANPQPISEYGKLDLGSNVYKVVFYNDVNGVFVQVGGDYYPEYKSNSNGALKYLKITKKEDKVNLTTSVQPNEAAQAGNKVNPEGKTQHTKNSTVSITATAVSGWKFKEYSGDLTGSTNPQSLKMTSDKTVIAHFEKEDIIPTLTLSGKKEISGICGNKVYQNEYLKIFSGTLSADNKDGWSISSMGFFINGKNTFLKTAKLALSNGNTYTLDFKENSMHRFPTTFKLNEGESINWILYLKPDLSIYNGCELPELYQFDAMIVVTDISAVPNNYSTGKKLPEDVLESGEKYIYCSKIADNLYGNLLEAVQNSKNDDIIELCEGYYTKKTNSKDGLIINKNITIKGIGEKENSIITDYSDGTLLFADSKSLKLENLTIQGSKGFGGKNRNIMGLFVNSSYSNITIKDIIFDGLNTGIFSFSDGTQNINIENTKFSNNDDCIYGKMALKLHNSYFKSNKKGIYLNNNSNTEIKSNIFENTNESITLNNSKDFKILDNIFDGGYNAIILTFCSNSTLEQNIENISNNTFKHSYDAKLFDFEKHIYFINLEKSNNITISNNKFLFLNFLVNKNIKFIFSGITLYNSNDNLVNNNEIFGTTYGLNLVESNNNSISENSIRKNFSGIHLFESSNDNTITSNTIFKNGIAIEVIKSYRNDIRGNNIYLNGKPFYIFGKPNNKLDNNSILNNLDELEGGIILSNSNANIFNNNFYKDSSAAIMLLDNSSANINFNNFIDNLDFAVDNRTSNIVNAKYNYWNSTTGPKLTKTGDGEKISNNIDYSNYSNQKYTFSAYFEKDTIYNPINKISLIGFGISNYKNKISNYNFSISDKLNLISDYKNKQVNLDTSCHFDYIKYSTNKLGNNEIYLESTSQDNETIKDTLLIITYEPTFKDFSIIPDTMYLAVNEYGIFNISAIDQYNNLLKINPSWSAESGNIDTNGIYKASNKTGTYKITAKYNNIERIAYVIVRDSILNIEDIIINNDEIIKVYPNPASEKLTIEFNEISNSILSINIFALDGKLISSIPVKNIIDNKLEIKLNNLTSGSYIISIDKNGKRYSKNFNIIR